MGSRLPCLIGRSGSCHEIDRNSAEEDQEEDRDNNGQLGNKVVVTRVIKTEGLQHTPETVVKVYSQRDKAENIEKAVEEAAQQLFDRYTDRYLGRCSNTETKHVNDGKQEDNESGVRHGPGSKGVLYNPGLNLVSGRLCLPEFEKQDHPDADMDGENSEQPEAEGEDKNRKTVQRISIDLKIFAAHVYCSIAECMHGQKEQQQQPGRGHKNFLADG